MFENEFMKKQSSIIYTCSEFAQNKADQIFAYLFMDNHKYYFNVFYRFGKETWDVEDLEYPDDEVKYFHELIKKDAMEMALLFDEAKREKPVLYKMRFRCKDQKFKFELKYTKDCDADLVPQQDFIQWKDSIKKKKILL